jgi:hypothetical protein
MRDCNLFNMNLNARLFEQVKRHDFFSLLASLFGLKRFRRRQLKLNLRRDCRFLPTFTQLMSLTRSCSANIESNLQNLRDYMNRILGSLVGQAVSPTGFASWWKSGSMTIEDALGSSFLVPLDVVNSWEVCISVLVSAS